MGDNADDNNQAKRASSFASSAQTNKISSSDPEVSNQKSAAESKRERFTQKLEGFSSVFEFAVAAAAVVGVLLVIVQIFYLGKSDRLSREALRLASETNASSDKTTAQILAKMEASNQATRDAIAESKRQAESSRSQSKADAAASRMQSAKDAAASLELARKSLEESQRALEISQRAWLGFYSATDYVPVSDVKGTVNVTIGNSGRLPATAVRVRINSQTKRRDEPPLEPDEPPGIISTSVIHPGYPQTVAVGISSLSVDQIEGVRSGFLILYVVGTVSYNDGFGKSRVTSFCAYHAPGSSAGWNLCAAGNKVE